MSPSHVLWGSRSADQLHRPNSEVRSALARRLDLDPLPDHAREPTEKAAVVDAVGLEPGEMEPDPADDVVGGVRADPVDRVVDGEEQVGTDSLAQCVLDTGGVPLRTRVREVPAEPQVGVEAACDPVAERRRPGRAAGGGVEVDQMEGPRDAGLAELQGRRAAEAWAAAP